MMLRWAKVFLDKTPKAQEAKAKINEQDYVKQKSTQQRK
jgi:hypothetical protein